MAEPTVAQYSTTKIPNLVANRINQKTFTILGTHTDSITTITTTGTISGVTAPLYLYNSRTAEVLYAEGISGATFTSCTRGADGTTKAAMTSGDVLYFCMVANDLDQIVREIIAIAVDAKDGANTERMAMQSAIITEIMRFMPRVIGYDWDNTHFLRGDNVFAGTRTDIPALSSSTTQFLRGDGTWNIPPTAAVGGGEFDIITYSRLFK